MSRNVAQVSIHPRVILDLGLHALAGLRNRPRQERMGFLFGMREDARCRIHAYAPYRGGLRTKDYAEYEEARVIRAYRRLEEASGLQFLGLYHSHPLRYNETIPEDLVALSRASAYDRASFRRPTPDLMQAYVLDAVLAVGPRRQARDPVFFPIVRSSVQQVRHRGRVWSLCRLYDQDVVLWMGGRLKIVDQPRCCAIAGGHVAFFVMSVYHWDREALTRCCIHIDERQPYAGRVTRRRRNGHVR